MQTSVLVSVLYYQFPIENHSSSCLGTPAWCLQGKPFSHEQAARCGIWSPVFRAGDMQMSRSWGKRQSCQLG